MFANPQLKEKQRRSIRASQMTLDYFCWLTMNIRADWGDIIPADRAENNFSLREAPKTTKPSQRKPRSQKHRAPKSRRNDLRMKPFSDFQIKNHIHVMLRQPDLDVLPDKHFMNEWLRQRADETRVQAVYENVKAELEPDFRETIKKGRRTAVGKMKSLLFIKIKFSSAAMPESGCRRRPSPKHLVRELVNWKIGCCL